MIEARDVEAGPAPRAELEREIDRTIEALAYFPRARRGLVVAIESLAEAFRREGDLDVIVDYSGRPVRLPDSVESALCRVVHSWLSHATTAGRCSVVRVALSFGERGVRLTVTDDGTGLTETIPDRGRAGSGTMRRIVTDLGGTFRLRNLRPRGAAVEAELPRGSA